MATLYKQLTKVQKDIDLVEKTRKDEALAFKNFLAQSYMAQEALFKAIKLLQAVYNKQGKLLLLEAKKPDGSLLFAEEAKAEDDEVEAALNEAASADASMEGTESKDGDVNAVALPPRKYFGRNVIKLLAKIGKHCVTRERNAKKVEWEARKLYYIKLGKLTKDLNARKNQYDSLSVTLGRVKSLLQTLKEDKKSTQANLLTLVQQETIVKIECDPFLATFEQVRKNRLVDIENLKRVKVLFETP